MLLHNRVDCVLGYAIENGYIIRKMDLKNKILFKALKETKGYTMSNIACSKTNEGKRIIERLNKVLIRVRPTKEYRSSFEFWLDKNIIPNYRWAYKKYFLTQK